MFVKNHTSYTPVLSRASVYGDIGVACVGLELTFDILDDGSLRRAADETRVATDPPDVRKPLLWRGTSVTAFGHVHGPPRGPYVVAVRLCAGDRYVDLAVYGNRRWERMAWGGWMQSAPEPFDAIPLAWERAYGGTAHLEPGFLPGTEMPHPGGDMPHPANPDGLGFLFSEEHARGAPIPNIEDPAALMAAPLDQPTPVGVAPCPNQPALRPVPASESIDVVTALEHSLVMQHHAPGPLIFSSPLTAGTTIETYGIGGTHLRFALPASPIAVHLRRGTRAVPTRERIRSVHVDGDKRRVRITWAHFERYATSRSPRFVEVGGAA